jgi:hypothetical protein
MAKVKMNNLIKALSGTVGGLVFRQMPDGSTWASAAPDFSGRKFSPGQTKHQQRFQEASAYARHAARREPIYTELAKGTTKNAYNIAISDWFHPPAVHQMQHRDGRIFVEVSDKVMVAKVVITMLDDQGTVLEKGEVLRVEGDWWEYAPSSTGKTITVEAWDLAGNVTKAVS